MLSENHNALRQDIEQGLAKRVCWYEYVFILKASDKEVHAIGVVCKITPNIVDRFLIKF